MDARRKTLVESLRLRFADAERRGDADAKQALFREAAYLGIPPELYRMSVTTAEGAPPSSPSA